MPSTSHFHHQIINLGFDITEDILHDMAAFAPSNSMCYQNTTPGNHRVFCCVSGRQCLTSWFFPRLIWPDIVRLIALKTGLLQEDTARRKRLVPQIHRDAALGFLVTDAAVMPTAMIRVTEVAHEPFLHSHHEVIVHRMRFFPLSGVFGFSAPVGRRVRRSVPSMMTSTETQSARIDSRFCGCRSGKSLGSPSARCKAIESL